MEDDLDLIADGKALQLEIVFHKFISANYTRDMEDDLDLIADGKALQLDVIRRFYDDFNPLVKDAQTQMEKLAPKETGELCPVCGAKMVWRHGRFGDFEGCGDYPKCKYVKPRPQTGSPKAKPEDTGERCPQCKKGTLVVRVAGKGSNKGNKFLACSNYPKCRYVAPYGAPGQAGASVGDKSA
jgi:DNA topoisomerase-1